MKKALLGLSNNISQNLPKIKVWANSFKRNCDGDVILLCANANDNDINSCKDIGILPVPVTIKNTWYINHERLLKNVEYLLSSDIDLFIVTDVFDVVFQGNPFDKLDLDYDLFVSGEGVLVNDEPWNCDNISKIFPTEIPKCRPKEVVCSGIIAGKREALIKLFTRMYELCESGSNNHNIKDQAALIVMLANDEVENVKIFNLDDAWAMHCAVAGPTQFFDAWGFRGKLMYGIPYMGKDGAVYNINHLKYDIVHQFNRIPEWNKILTEPYA